MIKHFLAAVAVATSLLLAGCSTSNLEGRPFFDTLEAPRADQATLYFYRVMPTIAAKVPATITVNGNTAGELLGGSYFVIHLPAGKYHIKSSTSPLLASRDNSAFDLQVESGKTYFIADQENTEPFKADGQLLGLESHANYQRSPFYFRYALVTQDEALRALKWCQKSTPVR
ncbi:DUF2846 domain-containing protein [Pseudomonas citronellolis]|uniref:DUF2846 domain-containing protein n=1 Tax=Pseudomonas citronellolis TaxID=53408 RepID=UPI0022BA34AA|nr:DUF2846 domain-containing protein [Pseudomonas citronellolis]WBG66476.1 DUF2846 domain-containing protein [Pseudomonas citronellolis]